MDGGSMDGWNWALLAVAAFVAVVVLVRLMLARRDKLVEELHQKMAAEKKKLQQAKKAKR
jgi:heme exporter protein D